MEAGTLNRSAQPWSSFGAVAGANRYRVAEGGTLVREDIWDFRMLQLGYWQVDFSSSDVPEAYASEEEMLYSTSHYNATQADTIRRVVARPHGLTESHGSG